MARKTKLTAVKLVKTMARARVGTVPAGQTMADKRARPPKHKPSAAARVSPAESE